MPSRKQLFYQSGDPPVSGILKNAQHSLQNRGYFFTFFRRARASARRARSARHSRREGREKITPVCQPVHALPFISCHVVMACYSTTKMAVASSSSVDEAVREVLRLFRNLPDIKEKQKKYIDLLLKSKDV